MLENQNNCIYSIYSLWDQILGALIYIHFITLILICFYFIIPSVNYVVYCCSSSRTTPGVITIQELHSGGKTFLQLLHKIGWVIDDSLKRQIKNRTLYTCRLFLLTRIFQYVSNWSKVREHLPTLFLQNIHRVLIF